jgi:hypothetical protein
LPFFKPPILLLFFYNFDTEVVAIPVSIYFWKNIKMIKIGTSERTDIAKTAPQFVIVVGSAKAFKARATGYNSGLFKYNKGPIKSSHVQ